LPQMILGRLLQETFSSQRAPRRPRSSSTSSLRQQPLGIAPITECSRGGIVQILPLALVVLRRLPDDTGFGVARTALCPHHPTLDFLPRRRKRAF
jgi:hypothetical protein